MARMSIYVPDELKARIDVIGDRVNWSNAAQAAFDLEIRRQSFPEEPTMDDVINRLRASKEQHETEAHAEGFELGKQWAMESAEYAELRAVCEIETREHYVDGIDQVLASKIEHNDWPEELFGDVEPTEAAVVGFIEGARSVWAEVSAKL